MIRLLALSTLMLGVPLPAHGTPRIGKPPPAIDIDDLAGRKVELAKLKGKVVVVDFWASWCKPCAQELPVLRRLQAAHAKDGMLVLAISVDEDEQAMRAFLNKHVGKLRAAWDSKQAVVGRYEPPKMPTSYFVDRLGVLRYVHRGFRAGDEKKIAAKLRELLAK